MSTSRDETFLNTPPCPFRRVSFGSAHCTISTDSHISEVDPLTCHNCEIPGVISKPRCRFLSLGTEIKPYRGEGKLVAALACRALNIKLYSLKACEECPLYSEVSALSDVIQQQQEQAEIQVPVRESLVEEIARDIKLDYGVREEETPPLLPIRCWRFPEGHCRKMPVYTARKVTVVLKHNNRNNKLWKDAILPTLRGLNLQPYRIDEEQAEAEHACRSCENIQESDYAILSLDDWSTNQLLLLGIAYGLGKRIALLKNSSLQPVPLLEMLPHDIVHYEQLGELESKLLEHFTPYVKPSIDDEN